MGNGAAFVRHWRWMFLLLFVGCSWQAMADGSVYMVSARQGIADLSNADFSKYKYALSGEWTMYPGQLLTPKDTAALQSGYIVQYPQLWTSTAIEGNTLPARGYATYRLLVVVPKGTRSADLALAMPDGYSSYRLFIDGVDFLQNGKPGTSAETTIPYFRPVAKRLHFDSDTFQILIQYANFHHQRGGPYRQLIIGDNDVLKNEVDVSQAYDIFMAGCLFMGGLFFLGLFLFGSHDRAILYFSLFCLCYIYRIIGVDQYTLHGILPGLNWFTAIRLEYLSLGGSIIFFVLYTRYLYPKEMSNWLTKGVVILSAAFLASLALPTYWFTHLLQPYLVVLVIVTCYIAYVYVLAALRRRPGAGYALMSTAVLMLIGSILIIEYLAVVDIPKAVSLVGYVLFFFLQSLILSYRFAYVLKKSRNDALEGIKAKSAFLSTMSHEIRTPLNSVIGLANLMLTKSPRPDQKEYLDTLLFSANHLLTTINDILDYNKIEAGKMELSADVVNLFDLSKQLADSARVLAQEKQLQVIFKCDQMLASRSVITDRSRMIQVITNLMHNAVKFTEKGSIALRLEILSCTNETVTVHISVSDTGIGIPPEKQKLIFEEFAQADSSITREFGGTGLGLALCRKILSMQHSELKVESEHGKGATFYFIQSYAWAADANEGRVNDANASAGKPVSLEGRSVLLVEDDIINTMVAEQLLLNMESTLRISNATNGEEAIKAYQQQVPDLILMDINMPLMDGLTATREIRKLEADTGNPWIPIIALTAGTLDDDAQNCTDAGMDAIVIKPFKPDDLRQTMLKLLEQKDRMI